MDTLLDKNCARAEMQFGRLIKISEDPEKGLDTVRLLQMSAGVLVELFLEYDNPGTIYGHTVQYLLNRLKLESVESLPKPLKTPPFVLDKEIEFGRYFAREIHLDNMDDIHLIQQSFIELVALKINMWAENSAFLSCQESIDIFLDALRAGLSLEIASQEICDDSISTLIGRYGWTLSDCVRGLSASAGQRMAMSLDPLRDRIYNLCDLISPFEQVAFLMTQEASRLGITDDSNWRKKLAANDTNTQIPEYLINGVDPICTKVLNSIKLYYPPYRAAAIAKATGRMIAVAAGGDMPELEPNVVKPLALTTMHETFKAQKAARFAS